MAADELTTALGAEVILFAVVFFPFRDMLGLWKWRHLISIVVNIIP
jgi:hypothetical protein